MKYALPLSLLLLTACGSPESTKSEDADEPLKPKVEAPSKEERDDVKAEKQSFESAAGAAAELVEEETQEEIDAAEENEN